MKLFAQRGGRPSLRVQSGMTLVEVAVALAIAGLLVGGIINGYNYCTRSSQKAALNQAANATAMERIEETRCAIWDTTVPTNQLVSANFPDKVVTLDLAGSGSITTLATNRTQITQISANPPLMRIRVDCIWRYKGALITNTIETCRAPRQ